MNKMTQYEAKTKNILVLAYIGDAVQTLYVRRRIVENNDYKAGKLNAISQKFVSAKGQSRAYDSIKEKFTEQEYHIANTARNTQTKNIAKNSDIETYKKATSLEAVFGYLYLSEEKERLEELLDMSYKVIENEN